MATSKQRRRRSRRCGRADGRAHAPLPTLAMKSSTSRCCGGVVELARRRAARWRRRPARPTSACTSLGEPALDRLRCRPRPWPAARPPRASSRARPSLSEARGRLRRRRPACGPARRRCRPWPARIDGGLGLGVGLGRGRVVELAPGCGSVRACITCLIGGPAELPQQEGDDRGTASVPQRISSVSGQIQLWVLVVVLLGGEETIGEAGEHGHQLHLPRSIAASTAAGRRAGSTGAPSTRSAALAATCAPRPDRPGPWRRRLGGLGLGGRGAPLAAMLGVDLRPAAAWRSPLELLAGGVDAGGWPRPAPGPARRGTGPARPRPRPGSRSASSSSLADLAVAGVHALLQRAGRARSRIRTTSTTNEPSAPEQLLAARAGSGWAGVLGRRCRPWSPSPARQDHLERPVAAGWLTTTGTSDSLVRRGGSWIRRT